LGGNRVFGRSRITAPKGVGEKVDLKKRNWEGGRKTGSNKRKDLNSFQGKTGGSPLGYGTKRVRVRITKKGGCQGGKRKTVKRCPNGVRIVKRGQKEVFSKKRGGGGKHKKSTFLNFVNGKPSTFLPGKRKRGRIGKEKLFGPFLNHLP